MRFRSWIASYRIVTHKASDWIRKGESARPASVEELPELERHEKKDFGVRELQEHLESIERAKT